MYQAKGITINEKLDEQKLLSFVRETNIDHEMKERDRQTITNERLDNLDSTSIPTGFCKKKNKEK